MKLEIVSSRRRGRKITQYNAAIKSALRAAIRRPRGAANKAIKSSIHLMRRLVTYILNKRNLQTLAAAGVRAAIFIVILCIIGARRTCHVCLRHLRICEVCFRTAVNVIAV